ncbi:hypothetical protein [Granulicatella seriolae]|uniref:DUF2798 domain-containing protein n=1 Tax=Granulicatella seriolae TaxID=2967226 RepID=A0ABT1WQB6_9LACT|nr:hypothetical protein [Granulicatella seriolae]
MLPFENEVQKATKTYMLIINIAFAAILLNAFIVAATFFRINQHMDMAFNNTLLTGSPTYAFLAATIPATIAYIFLRVVIQNYGENLRQSYMMTKTEAPIVETEDQLTEAK